MSRENVKVVRRLLWAFNNDADAWESMLSPELVWYPFENNHTPTYGIGGAARTRAHWLDAWDDARSDPEDIVGEGEHVVATVHLTGRGKTSGVKVDVRIHFHFKVRNVRQVFDAVARRDTDAVLALYDPDVELDISETELGALFGHSAYRGYEGLRSFDREWREAFENVETNCEELIEAGEHVVSISRYRMRGRESGIEIAGLARGGVWTIRAGKVARVRFFNTRDDALEAAGLSE